jgi:NAD(P)-dependent dehydrogenase (short-subunit alcohol dehydrogenase family)
MTGKVAFVTGAASGIGRATAQLFAARGYSVALADISQAGLDETAANIAKAGGTSASFLCDVADDASVKAAVEGAAAKFGRIDAAFNAAGIDGETGKFTADCTMENWHRIIGINLTGTFHVMRHLIPQMLAQGGGTIVNCASTAGLRGAATCGAYSASKHGVVGLTKTAALEYAGQGIRINAVCPGMIRTPMTQNGPMKDLIDQLVVTTPLGRLGEPQEIGAAVLWLSGEDASFMHGQAIAVDGAITSR